MLAEAKARDGKGVVKVIPAVGRRLAADPPKLRGKDDGANR
jgi:hypothetical protein